MAETSKDALKLSMLRVKCLILFHALTIEAELYACTPSIYECNLEINLKAIETFGNFFFSIQVSLIKLTQFKIFYNFIEINKSA